MSFAAATPVTRSPAPPYGAWRALTGFLLFGFLMALLGAILPNWGYHRDPPDFVAVGNYFLSLAVGLIVSLKPARAMAQRGLGPLLAGASALACAALVYLAFVSPPLGSLWRIVGLFVLGSSAGALNVGLFDAISPCYQQDPAGTVNRGGIFYGLGCLVAALLVAGTYYAYSVTAILLLVAVAPAIFAVLYARSNFPRPVAGAQPSLRQALNDFRSLGAILFALLLCFQFGNEWSLAGWMPLFLIRRLGVSPPGALAILAFYFVCLLTGRLIAVAILPRVRHTRLLLVSVMAALFGCLLLFSTNNAFGAVTAVFFLGGGYASIYPLVVEAIGRRFPYYHPGFFNGIFSLAQIGGLLAPASLGYLAAWLGVGVVIGVPLMGTFIVMALLLLIWLEAKITGR